MCVRRNVCLCLCLCVCVYVCVICVVCVRVYVRCPGDGVVPTETRGARSRRAFVPLPSAGCARLPTPQWRARADAIARSHGHAVDCVAHRQINS